VRDRQPPPRVLGGFSGLPLLLVNRR